MRLQHVTMFFLVLLGLANACRLSCAISPEISDQSPSVTAQETLQLDFTRMIAPAPDRAKLIDDEYYIWGACMVRDKEGVCHLFYSRWPHKHYFGSWLTHGEIAHAVADDPLGPYKHVDVALSARGAKFWDGLSVYNPTICEFDGKYYLYYTGCTGDGRIVPDGLNWNHRNNQRVGVAVADHPKGPWKRFDKPMIEPSADADASDSLVVNNVTVCRRPDGVYVAVYKAVGKKRPLPFGGPVVHRVATATSPTGPFTKKKPILFTSPKEPFPTEDPFIWTQGGQLWAIVKDHRGLFTKKTANGEKGLVLFTSKDGIAWEPAPKSLVSRYQVNWEGKGVEKVDRLERPQLWLDDGVPAVLFCSARPRTNSNSYNVHIPLRNLTGQATDKDAPVEKQND